jgi:hypothetical protein
MEYVLESRILAMKIGNYAGGHNIRARDTRVRVKHARELPSHNYGYIFVDCFI